MTKMWRSVPRGVTPATRPAAPRQISCRSSDARTLLLDPRGRPRRRRPRDRGPRHPSTRTGPSLLRRRVRPEPNGALATGGGPWCAAGRAALAQHHLHGLRGGAADGQGRLPHQFSVLTWASTGPLLAFGVAAPVLRQGRRPLRAPPPVPVRAAGRHGQRGPHGHRGRRRHAPLRPSPRWRAGRRHRDGVDGPDPRAVRARGPGQSARLVVPGRRRRTGSRRDAGLPRDPVLRLEDLVLGPAGAPGRRLGRRRRPPAVTAPGTRTRAGGRSGRAWTGSGAGPWRARSPRPCWCSASAPSSGGRSIGVFLAGVARRRARRPLRLARTDLRHAAHADQVLAPAQFRVPHGHAGFSNFAYFGGFFLFPLLMEEVFGYSVSQVGLISVARPLTLRRQLARRRVHDGAHGRARHRWSAPRPLRFDGPLRHAHAVVGVGGRHRGAGPLGTRHGCGDSGHVSHHGQRAGDLRVRRDERGPADGHSGRRGGRDPGGADPSGVARATGCIHHSTASCTASASRSGSVPARRASRSCAPSSCGRCPGVLGPGSWWPNRPTPTTDYSTTR